MTRVVIELCAAILIACAAYLVGHDQGRKVEQVKRAEAVATTQAAIDARDTAAASVSVSTQSYLWATLPAIDLRSHDARERVRTIYRDSPVVVGCIRPDGVQEILDAARERANAASGSVRASTSGGNPANPGAR